MYVMRLLPTVLMFSIAAASASGQTVIGVVVDEDTDERIEGVTVTLVGNNGAPQGGALSQVDGRFTLSAIEPGRYTLRAERIGYHTVQSEVFELVGSDTLDVKLRLSVDAVVLSPLTVTSHRGPSVVDPRLAAWGYYERRARYSTLGTGTAHFLDAAYIRQRSANRVSDLLRDLHGVHVTTSGQRGTVVEGARGCRMEVYLDGARIRGGIDDILVPSSVAAIEVYATFPYPAQYLPGPRGCGVVVIWSGWAEGKL